MSGSKSSGRVASPAEPPPAPISFAVHSMAAPDAAGAEARTRRGRLKMLLVLAACAAPVIASYLMYYVVRPEGRSNYSDLILPTRSMPALALQNLAAAPVPAASLRGQWLLVAVGPAACGEACEKRLFMQRQLREMLGRERERLDKVWLVTDGAAIAPALASSLAAAPATMVLRADREALAGWLQPAAGQQLEDHLYIVDPLGEWMMRVPAAAEPGRVKRDLDRLLRASGFWDVPGR